jgi:hypothetical protein
MPSGRNTSICAECSKPGDWHANPLDDLYGSDDY